MYTLQLQIFDFRSKQESIDKTSLLMNVVFAVATYIAMGHKPPTGRTIPPLKTILTDAVLTVFFCRPLSLQLDGFDVHEYFRADKGRNSPKCASFCHGSLRSRQLDDPMV